MSLALSQEQKNAVAQWVADGASLSEIQKRINAEFGVSMTYIDVRFLVDDLDLVLKDKETPQAQPSTETTTPADDAVPANNTNADFAEEPLADPAPAGTGKVSLTVDPVQRPGVALGGSVTFSDGQVGQWQLDTYGQLGFVPPHAGYQPTPADIRDFQIALKNELAKLGY